MTECITLSLPRTKCENVRVLFSRIRLLFGVVVDVTDTEWTSPGQGTVMTDSTCPETSRLILTLLDGNLEQLNSARDYLLAACSDSSSRCERRCQYASDIFQRLMPMRDEVERESCAMVKFEPQDNLVVASGLERNVLAAIRYLDTKAQDLVLAKSKVPVEGASLCREIFRQCRGHLESEDSSYDSDYENADAGTPSQETAPTHDDVSRTVSDTLAAEFDEYVTTNTSTNLRDLSAILSDPNYTSRVEFALKLGYTESQVQIALQKLGVHPSQNELLAELIKLGATCAQTPQVPEVKLKEKSEEGAESLDTTFAEVQRTADALDPSANLRHIVIDGSNVAMSHGNKECFSCRGIKLCVDWFKARGHQNITVFVPRWRKEVSRPDAPIKDQDILAQLEKERLLVFTPSRHVGGRRMVCYDDRYILRLAVDTDGIVVSNDNYKDLSNENVDYKKIVEDRLLMYSFVNDRFMPPEDPLGRHGPSLDNFLKKTPVRSSDPLPPPCPYGKKCTYGNKCKYYHPERGNQPQKSVTERLAEQAKIPLQEVKSRGLKSRESSPGDKWKSSAPPSNNSKLKKQPLSRTKSLIPSSTLIEGSLESKNHNVERTKSDSTSIRSSDDDLLKQQNLYHPMTGSFASASSTWSTVMPQISLTSATSTTSPTTANSWAALSSALPPNIPGTCAEMFLEPDSGGHLFVAKRLSDPDSHSTKAQVKSFPTAMNQEVVAGPNNHHRKLQRQLSLNPTCDPRLMHLGAYVGHQMLSPQSEQYGLLQQSEVTEPGTSVAENLPLHRGFGRSQTIHQPLSRMNSEGRVPNALQAVSHVWDGCEHQTVTRIASAPDSSFQWQPLSRMQHLNSTSDTRLNLYPDFQRGAVQTSSPLAGGYTTEGHQWISPNHPLEPPRAMSPIVVNLVGPSKAWQDHAMNRTSLGQPVRPSSVPPHGMLTGLQNRPQTPELPADARYKLEYHLSSIFPKEQVRAAMDIYPQETNPQKICAAILSMFPQKG